MSLEICYIISTRLTTVTCLIKLFGTGDGFTADEINAGTLNAGQIQILGTDQFYWDADNIYIYDTVSPLNQIRVGRYDGINYGIGFTKDGGSTWQTAIGFDGVKIGSLTVQDIEAQLGEVRIDIFSSEGVVYNSDVSSTFSTTLYARIFLGTTQQDDTTGYSFQWQELNEGGSVWVNIAGATSSTFLYDASYAKQVRCKVTK